MESDPSAVSFILGMPEEQSGKSLGALKELMDDLRAIKTATLQKARDTTFPFLSLPQAVRERVYYFAFASSTPTTRLRAHPNRGQHYRELRRNDRLHAPGLSILTTSKAVYKESIQVFYGCQNFSLQLYRFAKHPGKTSRNLQAFAREVTIELTPRNQQLLYYSQLAKFDRLQVLHLGVRSKDLLDMPESEALKILTGLRGLGSITMVLMGRKGQIPHYSIGLPGRSGAAGRLLAQIRSAVTRKKPDMEIVDGAENLTLVGNTENTDVTLENGKMEAEEETGFLDDTSQYSILE